MPAEDPNHLEGDETAPVPPPGERRASDHASSLSADSSGHCGFSPGTLLADRFQILKLLGTGGMGEVYLAQDARLDRQVAIKFLSDKLARDREWLARFEREARTAARLNHPNVATVYDFGQSEGVSFIAMELLEGRTLRDVLLEHKSLPVVDLLDIAIQVVEGLDAAHQRNIVHRDLKPGNVMVLEGGRVKILDFGLAKAVDSDTSEGDYRTSTGLTREGRVFGTVNYMSPEQARGEELDARTDLFSFGVVLYEMATGSLPFQGKTSAVVFDAILHQEPISAVRLNPRLPAEIELIIAKALEKDRSLRYQHASDMLTDLKRVKRDTDSGRSATSVAVRTIESPKSRALPRRLLWSAASITLVLILSIAAWIRFFGPQDQSSEALRTVPFTSFPGNEWAPALSPDGNRIAFVWGGERADNTDIYVKLIGTGRPRRITTHHGFDERPTWSHDGLHIAFLRYHEGGRGIFIVDALGTTERALHSGFSPGSGLDWSGDGKHLAFEEQSSPEEPRAISLLAVETLDTRILTSPPQGGMDYSPTFSPDGEILAFIRLRSWSVEDIYLVSVIGGEPTRLTFDNLRMGGLAWTADGREIVFSSKRGGNLSLWRISASGGEPRRLVGVGDAEEPSISRQGNRLAYVQSATDWNIWRSAGPNSIGEPGPPVRWIHSTRGDHNPQFSPDGKRIVFTSHRSGSGNIWMCDSDGSGAIQLTDFDGTGVGSPRWSPDSQQVAFDSDAQGHNDIYVVSVEERLAPRRLTTETTDEWRPSWSRDGQSIYFGSNRSGDSQIWKMPAQGGRAVCVTKKGGYEAFEGPDGHVVYYHMENDSREIRRVPVEGGEETRVLVGVPLGSWAVMDRGICFLDRRPVPGPAVQLYSFGTGELTQINVLENARVGNDPRVTRWRGNAPNFAVSPDGRWILYVQRDQTESDIMLVENFR